MRILIATLFLSTAAYLWFSPAAAPPIPVRTPVDRSVLTSAPPRQALGDPPTVLLGGLRQRCSNCHRLFPSRPETPADLQQHRDVVLDHGLNDRCHNCHSPANHEKLLLENGVEIPFGEAVRLCARCHGPTYRDWLAGMHGRTQGSWDPRSGRQSRLSCTQCHDPHKPAQTPLVPLPGPNTLRMGPVAPDGHGHEGRPRKTSPLLLRGPGRESEGSAHNE